MGLLKIWQNILKATYNLEFLAVLFCPNSSTSLDIRMSKLDIRLSKLDIRMSKLDIRMSKTTMLVLLINPNIKMFLKHHLGWCLLQEESSWTSSILHEQRCLSVLSWNYNVLIIRRARKFFSMPIDSYLRSLQGSIINHILYISSNIYPTLLSCSNLVLWNMYILYIN